MGTETKLANWSVDVALGEAIETATIPLIKMLSVWVTQKGYLLLSSPTLVASSAFWSVENSTRTGAQEIPITFVLGAG